MAKKNKVVFDSLVTRDKNIIELIEKVGVITREQVQRVLFKNVHQNVYVYYLGKKPSKRNIQHEITVTEFITNVMAITDVLEVNTHYVLGDIIADGYIKYRDSEGKIRRLLLEVQLSNKVGDCINKYNDIKRIILDNRPDWQTIPRLIVITYLEHNNEQLKHMKVKYDTTDMENLRELLF